MAKKKKKERKKISQNRIFHVEIITAISVSKKAVSMP